MAISAPTERYAQSLTAQAATTAFSPATTIVAGTTAILIATTGVAGLKKISSVTDSAGNTWAVDLTGDNSGVGDNKTINFASCQVTTQLTTSSVITITWSISTNNQCHIWVQEVAGLAAAAPFDKSAVHGGNSATKPTAGPTATLSQADEIVFAAVRCNDVTGWTPDAGYSNSTTATLNGLSAIEYEIVSAITPVSVAPTITNNSQNVCGIATYKGPPPSTSIKTVNGLAKASVKTMDGLSTASVKSIEGLV